MERLKYWRGLVEDVRTKKLGLLRSIHLLTADLRRALINVTLDIRDPANTLSAPP
ncbi:MAG: hypothetical protein UW00_C0015G0011 [Parcubacteria group bacterium GW2011_GWB1_43_66]|nr:MAG: hypothetical protein UW00_C0015G0011 [Parcubacteria group bacterium GW2011_GWB1_43_66]